MKYIDVSVSLMASAVITLIWVLPMRSYALEVKGESTNVYGKSVECSLQISSPAKTLFMPECQTLWSLEHLPCMTLVILIQHLVSLVLPVTLWPVQLLDKFLLWPLKATLSPSNDQKLDTAIIIFLSFRMKPPESRLQDVSLWIKWVREFISISRCRRNERHVYSN